MLSLAQCVTGQNSVSPDITSLHSDVLEEETFLRAIEKGSRVYFDWGYHTLHIFIGEGEEEKNKEPKDWLFIGADRFVEIAEVMAITSADTVVVMASMKMSVIICNTKEYGPKSEDERNDFLKTIRNIIPDMKVVFWGRTE